MGLKIMAAGCSPDEKVRAEDTVKRTLGLRSQSGEWSVSLVKVGDQWSVSLREVQGPSRTFTTSWAALNQGLLEAIREVDPAEADAQPAAQPPAATSPGAQVPQGVVAPGQPASPSAGQPLAQPQLGTAPAAVAQSPPAAAPVTPQPATPIYPPVPTNGSPATGTPQPVTDGEQSDRYTCRHCQRPFSVHYFLQPGEALESAPVACPHCWQISEISVGREAALAQDYRAEKASP